MSGQSPREAGEAVSDDGTERDPGFWADHDEREAALIYEVWSRRVEDDDIYQELKATHRERTDTAE